MLSSILDAFPTEFQAHVTHRADPVQPTLIAALREIDDGIARWDPDFRTKQPDWTHDPVDSGQWPADRLDDPRGVDLE